MTTFAGHILFIKNRSSLEESINQRLSIVLVVSTQLDDRTTGLRARSSSHRVCFTCSKCNGTEDLLIIGFSKSETNLFGDLRTQGIVSKSLIQIIDEGAGDQQVVHDDGLFCHWRITTTQNRCSRGMVISSHASSKDELHGLTIGQSAVLHSTFSDTGRLISFEHFTTEQLQISSVFASGRSIIITLSQGDGRRIGIKRTNRSYGCVSHYYLKR